MFCPPPPLHQKASSQTLHEAAQQDRRNARVIAVLATTYLLMAVLARHETRCGPSPVCDGWISFGLPDVGCEGMAVEVGWVATVDANPLNSHQR